MDEHGMACTCDRILISSPGIFNINKGSVSLKMNSIWKHLDKLDFFLCSTLLMQ